MLADARGVPMKFGQFLASGDEGAAYRPLLDGVEPESLERLRPHIEASLGAPLASVFT